MKNEITAPPGTSETKKRRLAELLSTRSKHSTYQELHPLVQSILGFQHSPSGKHETLRWAYMATRFDFASRLMLDIGANTGYFSLAAMEQGARGVYAFEGNSSHAEFLREAAFLLQRSDRLTVYSSYFDFDYKETPKVDITLCLNVLHHLGDDFGSQETTLAAAKQQMGQRLRLLAKKSQYCWFQMGFNWKGDRHQPLFKTGNKTEMIEFVCENCANAWLVEDIAIYEPATDCYKPACDLLLQRFDDEGEFLNRPIFLLKSSIQDILENT
ncbi:MAG: class I SAM-dependent methyltransferase [Desulfobulbus sp.]|nr:class I SAM-dependent methyltransferase [Desulfobulbus sp.]